MSKFFSTEMKVALVHDDLVQWGGAERVFLKISEIFPDAPIYTSLYDRQNPFLKTHFGNKKIFTSFLQQSPGWRSLYKLFLPLYGLAFEQFDFSEYDLVISHTTRFAKSIITKPKTLHICYCHTPVRFLWNFPSDNYPIFLKPLFNILRKYDYVSSKRVDYWIAGSENARLRIKKIYGSNSDVCVPFVSNSFLNYDDNFDGGYFLIVSRLNRYKRIDLAINVFNKSGNNLKIVGSGPMKNILQSSAKKNIEFLGNLEDKYLIKLISGCKALIIIGEEDFGITSLEAQALGKPVIAYKAGGVLETVTEGVTGIFFESQNQRDLEIALDKFKIMKFSESDCRENAKKFSENRFKENFFRIINKFYDL